jgi:hypothetical protein
VTPEQIPVDYQLEPHDKCEHRDDVHQEISICETFLNEEHPILPCAVVFNTNSLSSGGWAHVSATF